MSKVRSIVCLTIGLAVVLGCGAPAPEPEPEPLVEPAEPAEPSQTYTVRGEVTEVEVAEDGTRLFVHHEAIHDFRVGGEVVGMDSMTMPFALAVGVPAEGIEVGTRVEFDWTVDADTPAGEIVRLDVLAPGTPLSWEAEGDDRPAEGGAHDGH